MNPRDLPKVGAELQSTTSRIDRLASQMQAAREENRENTDRLLSGFQRMLEPFLNRRLEHNDQLRNHESRLNNFEYPQQ
jgi:hypothetical protein